MSIRSIFKNYRLEILFLSFIYFLSVYLRLAPRLALPPEHMGFLGDAWYRIAIAEYFKIHGELPGFSIRYQAYGWVPMFYSFASPIFFATLSEIFNCSIPVVCTRIIPFFEALTPIPFYFLARHLFSRKLAVYSTLMLAISPAFIIWTGVSDPISVTLFIFPMIIYLFVRHCQSLHENKLTLFRRIINILLIGALFAGIFIFHQSYFLIMPIYFSLVIYLSFVFKSKKHIVLDSFLVVVVSLLMTMPWWKPDNLFYWWFRCLMSPGHGEYPDFNTQCLWYGKHLAYFTLLMFFLYLLYLLYILISKSQVGNGWKVLIPMVLLLAPIYGLLAEIILTIIGVHNQDILQSNIIKPLRADRFHVFLAQPMSLVIGIIAIKIEKEMWPRVKNHGVIKYVVLILIAVFGGAFFYRVMSQDIPKAVDNRLKWTPFTEYEYLAAKWFKENSGPDDRIIADYHRGQMFSGVVGGKALLGIPLPLRTSMNLPYRNRAGGLNLQLKKDIRIIYGSEDAFLTKKLMDRYGCTHVLVSAGVRQHGYFSTPETTGTEINQNKFDDISYFDKVYDFGGVYIYKLKNALILFDNHKFRNLALWAKPIGGSQTGEILNINVINDNSLGDNYDHQAARTHPAIKGAPVWAWFGLDFGKEVYVNRIKAYPALFIYPEEFADKSYKSYMAKKYVLQYYDSNRWVDIPNSAVEQNVDQIIECDFNTILTQKIRIYIHDEYDDAGVHGKESYYRAACLELSAFNVEK